MTRKDFELIARAVMNTPIAERDRVLVTSRLAEALSTTNPQFDRARFIFAATSIDIENDDSAREFPELAG